MVVMAGKTVLQSVSVVCLIVAMVLVKMAPVEVGPVKMVSI